MFKGLIKSTAYQLAPSWARVIDERRWLVKQARALQRECARHSCIAEIVDRIANSPWFVATQKPPEILRMLELVRGMKARRLCEIGAAAGGTLFLLCQAAPANAQILSIDVSYTPARLRAFPHFARAKQHVCCLGLDSHSIRTLALAKEWLGGQMLDFLFIDGDHSLEGVRRDYEMYAPCVRAGGIIAFHDIVPDYKTRFGRPTAACAGDVPAFWRELKSRPADCLEIIADPDQDGYGIGVLRATGKS
jgi:predicted O-methyltransferase YrrM